jgi:hypothetical protein
VKRPIRKKRIVNFIEGCIRERGPIEIDGLGSLELEDGQLVFQPSHRKRVFIGYAKEDIAKARKLYRLFKAHGLEPWLDEEKVQPGQNWPRAIVRAVEAADYAVICFSRQALKKRGFFQCELRYALDVATSTPPDQIYLLPVRLVECEIPPEIARTTQYVDLFPDWEAGVNALLKAMAKHS